jgi:hypothetical protein
MYFCIRDDDTSFFTAPDELECVYGEVTKWGPVSLAVVPFHRAGTSKAVPEKFRGRGSVHPLHENRPLVEYLRAGVSNGRFEIMLHGYHHDEPSDRAEFSAGSDLARKIIHGRKYLEDLLGASIRVFVPPHNTIGRKGLQAIVRANLHLGCVAGVRSGWSPTSQRTWRTWLKLRRWQKSGGLGIPWILDLGDHREIAGTAITPTSVFKNNKAAFEVALIRGGTFCAATHYWELGVQSINPGDPPVGAHLRHLIDLARTDPRVIWRSVGEVVCNSV